LYDKILDINENVFWAANGEDADSSNRLLDGLDTLMAKTVHDLDLTGGKNIGLKKSQKVDCSPKNYVGFADYGDSFGPNTKKGYVASIEIPMSVLCDEHGNAGKFLVSE
jgi:hypothetical protein